MQVALNHTFRLQTIKGLAGSRHVSHNRPNRQKTGVNARRGRKPSLVWGGGHLSNGGGSGGGDSNNTRAGSGDDNGHSRPSEKAQAVLIQLLYAFVAWMAFLLLASGILDLSSIRLRRHDTSNWRVSIVIPVLNEERCIRSLLQSLRQSFGNIELIVIDGGSTDSTLAEARKGGASHILVSKQRGRSAQMNAGAEVATGELLVFMHADTTKPPKNLPMVLRQALADPRTVLVGFRTLIRSEVKSNRDSTSGSSPSDSSSSSSSSSNHSQSKTILNQHSTHKEPRVGGTPQIDAADGPLLKWMTLHQLFKTSFYPMLLQPLWFIRGFRLLFGDQVMCCRRSDFLAVKGFNPSLPIMEDADLCIRLHESGPSSASAQGYIGHGRVRQLMGTVAETSGRRLETWGNVWGTYVLFRIALAWYQGADGERLKELYARLYTDAFR